MNQEFKLCQGVLVEKYDMVKSAFTVSGDRADGVLSSELIESAAREFVNCIDEPVFFFLELPVDAECSSYDTYYLDNCTREVALAVIKRYGALLAADGTSRFGFGCQKTDDEIYFEDYQEFMIYSHDIKKELEAIEKLGAVRTDKLVTLWDKINDENVGCLSTVEIDGETVFDIPENLSSAGMYKA